MSDKMDFREFDETEERKTDIVDIVETGSTLKANNLEVIEDVTDISARLIANTVSLKLRKQEIEGLAEKLERERLLKEIVEYVHNNDFGPTDQEYMITDPFATYIEKGGVMRAARVEGEYLDGGTVEGWVHANDVVCGSKD